MFCDVTQHFLSFCRQIDAIHRNSIAFVVLRCYDRFVIKSMQVIVLYSLALFWMFCDVTQHYWSFRREIDANHCYLITCSFALFSMFCEVTKHIWSFCRQMDAIHRNSIAFVVLRCYARFVIKSMQVIVLYSLALFWMFCDVTQHYWSFWREIDANHCYLITCSFALFSMFCEVTKHIWSFCRQMDAIHRNSIAFVVLGCYDRFVIKSMQVIVVWALL